MAMAALATDTGGSCRIPAALCGIVGFKPTAARVPTAGTMPLSQTLDSIGPLAPTVACCAVLDAVLAGQAPGELGAAPAGGRRRRRTPTLGLRGPVPRRGGGLSGAPKAASGGGRPRRHPS